MKIFKRNRRGSELIETRTRITEDEYSTYGVAQYLHRQAIETSAELVEKHLGTACIFNEREQTWKFCIEKVKETKGFQDGLILEFGVARGGSVNYLARSFDQTIYGFDSFEGLRTDWIGWNQRRRSFTRGGKPPKVRDNVVLVKGWIEDTLPEFLEREKPAFISFIHVDTDLYEPAAVILKHAKGYLRAGSIILFDELISYTGWREHEFKALNENFSEDEFDYIAFSNYKQGAIRIR